MKSYLCLSLISACLLVACAPEEPHLEKEQPLERSIPRNDWSSFSSPEVLPEHAEQEILLRYKKGTDSTANLRLSAFMQSFASKSVVTSKDPDKAYQWITLKPSITVLAALQSLERESDVDVVQPNFTYHFTSKPNDPLWPNSSMDRANTLWNLEMIKSESAWNLALGSDAVIAVLDSGLDSSHDDAPALWKGEDDINGYNCISNNNDIGDVNGHGTHVSGIAAAKGNNERGTIGVAPLAKVMMVKVSGGSATATTHTNRMVCGLNFVEEHGADVVNMSLGIELGGTANDTLLHEAIQGVHDKGIPIVASSGNDGREWADRSSPAKYPEVISVGSVDEDRSLSYFSNYGSTLDFVAPGRDVISLLSHEYALAISYEDIIDGSDGNEYAPLSGTSMSAPHVTGLIALLKSMDKTLTPDQIYDLLKESSQDLGDDGFDIEFGYGLIDAGKTVANLHKSLPKLNILTKGTVQVAAEKKNTIPIEIESVSKDVEILVLNLPPGAKYNSKAKEITWTPALDIGTVVPIVVQVRTDRTLVEKYVYLSVVEKVDGQKGSGGCSSGSPATLFLIALMGLIFYGLRPRKFDESND